METIRSIGSKNPLTFRTSYFVCCQDVVETSSPGPKDPVSWSARPWASVFGEVLSQKKTAKIPPKSKPLRD